MGLSSNVIWHQTNFDSLKAILPNMAFKPSYSLETINWRQKETCIAFPMISFCDIPFADLSEYLTDNKEGKFIGKYGKYTIGMKRQWGQKKGLSSVWYRDKNATSLYLQMTLLQHALKKKISFNMDETEQFLWYISAYTKNIQGKLLKYGFESYRFANEKELRFVPTYEQLKGSNITPYILDKDYVTLKEKLKKNNSLDEFHITFTMDDIAYILVSSSSQINKIKRLFGNDREKIVFMSYNQVIHDIIGTSHNKII